MANLREFFSRIGGRRKVNVPVDQDRRGIGLKEAKDRLKSAHDRLEEMVKQQTSPRKREVANDIQHQVQFVTFRDICTFSGSKELAIRLCKHPKHEAANTGIATCDELLCPLLREITAMSAT